MNDDLAEQSVLSCCYQSPLALERASAILTAADFYNPKHERLWGVLKALKAEGRPTDATAVQLALKGDAVLMSAHLAAASNPAVVDSVEHYASEVKGFSRRRQIIAACRNGFEVVQKLLIEAYSSRDLQSLVVIIIELDMTFVRAEQFHRGH